MSIKLKDKAIIDSDRLDGKDSSQFALSSHGNHVPVTQTANNKKFLRCDNTWQDVTPGNIGAATVSHTHSYLPLAGGTLTGKLTSTGAIDASAITTANKQLLNVSSNTVYVGNPTVMLNLESSTNPKVKVGSALHTLYHTGNKPTSAEIGALPSSGGSMNGDIILNGIRRLKWNCNRTKTSDIVWNASATADYGVIHTVEGVDVMVLKTNGVNTQKTLYANAGLQVTGMSVTNGNTDINGKLSIYSTHVGADYMHSNIELREKNQVGSTQAGAEYAPSLGFHWGNRNAGSIAMHSDGTFHFRAQGYTGSQYRNIHVSDVICDGVSLKQSVGSGKNAIASAITAKGISASGSEDFASLANKIGQIEQTPSHHPSGDHHGGDGMAGLYHYVSGTYSTNASIIKIIKGDNDSGSYTSSGTIYVDKSPNGWRAYNGGSNIGLPGYNKTDYIFNPNKYNITLTGNFSIYLCVQ